MSNSGENNHFYGKHHTKESRLKMSQAHLGKNMGDKNPAKRPEVRAKISQTLLNHFVSMKTKEKCRRANLGKHYSPKTEFKKGQVAPNKGKKIEKISGDKHWNWRGGKSLEPYGLEFNEDLKEVIRNRDRRKCFICEKTELETGKKLSIHHIDYNKKNNNPNNLVTLCRSCHAKTNFNRKNWIKYFNKA